MKLDVEHARNSTQILNFIWWSKLSLSSFVPLVYVMLQIGVIQLQPLSRGSGNIEYSLLFDSLGFY